MPRLPKINPLTDDECKALSSEHVTVLKGIIDGRKYEELALSENVPVGTIRSRINRARTHLNKLRAQAADQLQAAE